MTNSIGELENSPFIFAIGTNTTESHPVIAVRIKMAVKKGARLLVADPRRIDLTRFAYQYLPMKIGSDVALINAMCHVIIAENLQRQTWEAAAGPDVGRRSTLHFRKLRRLQARGRLVGHRGPSDRHQTPRHEPRR